MTDDTQEPTDTRTGNTPTWEDGRPMKMGEMDHTPPVEGPNRTFERAYEGRPPRPDGGHTTEPGGRETGDQSGQRTGERDHSPPVSGPSERRGNGDAVEE